MLCSHVPFRIHLPMDQKSKETINFIIYSFKICTTYEVDIWKLLDNEVFYQVFNQGDIKLSLIFLGYIITLFIEKIYLYICDCIE